MEWDATESSGNDEASVAKSRRPLVWLIALLVVAGMLAAFTFNLRSRMETFVATDPMFIRPPELAPDRRWTFDSPFRNIRPDVEYVGDQACAKCHQEIDQSFHAHPMGRSARTTIDDLEQFDDASKAASHDGDWEWTNTHTDGQLVQTLSRGGSKGKDIAEMTYSPQLVIGSGVMGRSYIESRGGEAWQTPVSWFTTIHQWDVSPGAVAHNDLSMPTDARCLGCHVQDAAIVPFTQHRLTRPLNAGQVHIGCERCHGPGDLHVRERTAGTPIAENGIDTSIVSPRHLSIDLRMAICQQCHVSGFTEAASLGRSRNEFRPGMPLELFVSVYTVPPGESKGRSVQQFEQMIESRCYTESKGTFDCISCHNPHEKPAKADVASYFRERCLKCHQDKSCAAPEASRQSVADSCIECHMPRAGSVSIAHASVTDHRILRDRNQERVFPKSSATIRSDLPFVPASLGKSVLPPEEERRNFGVALAGMVQSSEGTADPKSPVVSTARELLTAATAKNAQDHDAWLGLATLEEQSGNTEAAIKAVKHAVTAVPQSEIALRRLVTLTMESDKQTAADASVRLMRLNPDSPTHLRLRGETQLALRDAHAASVTLQKAITIQPLDSELRLLLALALKEAGNNREAEAVFAAAMGLTDDPGRKAEYRKLFYSDPQR
jgi:hypothetical protein